MWGLVFVYQLVRLAIGSCGLDAPVGLAFLRIAESSFISRRQRP